MSAELKSDPALLCGCVGTAAAGNGAGKHLRRFCPVPLLPGNPGEKFGGGIYVAHLSRGLCLAGIIYSKSVCKRWIIGVQ